VIFLITDLDDPFEFELDGTEAGAAEVSLKPIVRVQEELAARVKTMEGSPPSDDAGPAGDQRAP
jgi:hypothetical protein